MDIRQLDEAVVSDDRIDKERSDTLLGRIVGLDDHSLAAPNRQNAGTDVLHGR